MPATLSDYSGDGFVDRAVDREDLRQAGDLEHLEDPLVGAHQGEVAVVAAQPLEPAHQHAEAGRVEEVHALQVDDDLVLALAHQFDQLFPQPGRRVDVDFPFDRQHRVRAPAVVYLETEFHRSTSSVLPNLAMLSQQDHQ